MMEFSWKTQMIICVTVVMVITLNLGTCSINLALHKPVWMSSQHKSRSAINAVDGRKSEADGEFTGIHTVFDDPTPWLVVDLLGQYYVSNVTIYNRMDCCSYRLDDFILEVFMTDPTRCLSAQSSAYKHYQGVFGLVETVVFDTPTLGRYLRIRKTEDVLNLDEIEVYAQGCRSTITTIPVLDGKRVISNNATIVSASSRLACVTECEMMGACIGVNYNSELLQRSDPIETVNAGSNWVYCGHELC